MISIGDENLAACLAFAHELADAAAKVTMSYFRQRLDVVNKDQDGRFDPVTLADREAETVIRDLIRHRYPAHGVVGEEHGSHGAEGPHWVIDPIDGTRAFISGLPLWGTLIAFNDGGAPIVGIIDHPATGERFVGCPEGAFLKCQRLSARPCPSLAAATLSTTDPDLFTGRERDAFNSVLSQVKLKRYGYDCYAYAMVAAGGIDLVIESGLQTYDVQALIPVVEAAGGIITDWQGGSAITGGQVIAAGDRRVHAEALAVLASGSS